MNTQYGALEQNFPLRELNSWRIGGLAEYLFKPKDLISLANYIKQHVYEPITFLGLGSNVLISDAGVQGHVILTHQALSNIQTVAINEKQITIRVDAGVTCAKVAKFLLKAGYVGGEFLAGIPGTIGGSAAMNAGAWGSEIWQFITGVSMVAKDGSIANYTENSLIQFKVGYRQVVPPLAGWFLSIDLTFNQGDTLLAAQKIKQLLRTRALTQPIGEFSCGSVFVNPTNDHAARLIEAVGLKGFAIGDAQISTKHANFIINNGHASASNVMELIQHIKNKVNDEFEILLKTEVRFLE